MMQSNINIQAEASALMLQAVTAITETQKEAQELDKDTQVYNMTTGLFPCTCVAMYETILSPTIFEQNLNDGEDEFYYNTVDYDDWRTSLMEAAQEYLDDHVIDSLKNYGLENITACSIWSPKYYNYHQDELVMDVKMKDGWQSIMAQKINDWQGRENVEKYIRTYWHSYSGYINFMPESLQEILDEENEDRQLAAYLTLAMLVEGSLRPCDDVMEELYYRMDDFSGYSRVNIIEEYLEDQDEAQKLQDLWNDDIKWNELYWDLCGAIGRPWAHDEDAARLWGKKDTGYCLDADSDGMRLLFWAIQHQYTVDDLYSKAGKLEEIYF